MRKGTASSMNLCNTYIFSTKTFCEIFKIQTGSLNCNSQKIVYLLKCKIFGEDPFIGKVKMKSRIRFNDYENVHMCFRKKTQSIAAVFYEHYGQHMHSGIADCSLH